MSFSQFWEKPQGGRPAKEYFLTFGMAKIIHINDISLTYMEWDSKPVVTRQQVADLHRISVQAVRDSHNRNAQRFRGGVDYFRLTGEQIKTLAQDAPEFDARTPSLTVYTERGYLKLAKTFTDDTAWEVQDRLIDSYFRLQELSAQDREIEYLKRRILIAQPKKWKQRFPHEVRDHICRLWGARSHWLTSALQPQENQDKERNRICGA